ncbi:MAG: protoporphyrinogen oxidase [bacterium]|nr:protoporphyrinogen oxidase [bacterium]
MAKCIIIGAGISGLSAAHAMQRAGHDVTVLESSSRAGGSIQTERDGEWLFERGPNSFLDNEPATLELIRELKLDNRVLRASMRANKRFIYLKDALQEVPMGPGGLYSTPLLSAQAKRGLLMEPFRQANRSKDDEPLAAFIRRRLGDEILANLVTPFVSGVYAGDPEKLSLRASFPALYDLERESGGLLLGGLGRAFRKKKDDGKPKKPRARHLGSFVEGMDELPRAIAAELGDRLKLNARAAAVERTETGAYSIRMENGETLQCDTLIAAAPSYVLGDLLGPMLPRSAEYLKSIPYNKVVVSGLGYDRDNVENDCDGFGFLVPRNQPVRFLGSIWSSSLFPLRAPGGKLAFTVFMGGALDSGAYDLSDDDLRATLERDLRVTVGARGEAEKEIIARWEKAIPQYPVGHVERIDALEDELTSLPGLYLTGNFMRGVSVNDCIRTARETAQKAAKYLSQR